MTREPNAPRRAQSSRRAKAGEAAAARPQDVADADTAWRSSRPARAALIGRFADEAEAERTHAALVAATAARGLPVQWWPWGAGLDASAPPLACDLAVVANPPPGALGRLQGLRFIQSLWAGVERLLADPSVPTEVPLARLVDPAMTAAMTQTAVWATLSLHRGFFQYAAQQREGLWAPRLQRRADEVPVAVLGGGVLGRSAAQALAALGYPVRVWRRSGWEGVADDRVAGAGLGHRSGDASTAFSATAPAARGPSDPWPSPSASMRPTGASSDTLRSGLGLGAAPARSARPLSTGRAAAARPDLAWAEVVINLLPLTAATRALFDRSTFAQMRPGAGFVNLARGGHVVEADLIAALDSGTPGHAVLDVFQTEPLPADSPLWRHPGVTVLPHVAARTDERTAAGIAAQNLARVLAGQAAEHVVDRAAGY